MPMQGLDNEVTMLAADITCSRDACAFEIQAPIQRVGAVPARTLLSPHLLPNARQCGLLCSHYLYKSRRLVRPSKSCRATVG